MARKLSRTREIRALAQDNQRPVFYLQHVAVPSPFRHGAGRGPKQSRAEAAAEAPHLRQPRTQTQEPRAATAAPFLRSTRSDRLYPTGFSRVSEQAMTCFPQREFT